MTAQLFIQVMLYLVLIGAFARLLAIPFIRAYQGEPTLVLRLCGPLERLLCRLADVPAGPGPLPTDAEMSWQSYTLSILVWNGVGVAVAYALLHLPYGAATRGFLRGFVAATTALSVLIVLVRGLRRQAVATVGNFWADLIRGTLYILLPLAVVLLALLSSAKVVQWLSFWLGLGMAAL